MTTTKATICPVPIADSTAVAKETTPASDARNPAPEVSEVPGDAASDPRSDRGAKRPPRVFTWRSGWRITTDRTAQKRSHINPLGRRKQP